MNRLIAELHRLYFLPGPKGMATPESLAEGLAGRAAVTLDPVGPDGTARTLAVVFERAADWEQVAGLHRGVQEELELPAPVLSIAARDGFCVWFSLAEAVPVQQAHGFLEGIRRKFLADMPPARLHLCPASSGEGGFLDLVPARHEGSGKWSAFIDPDMGSMFADAPGLEMAPNLDKQADLLSGFESIEPADFLRALNLLQPSAEPDSSLPEGWSEAAGGPGSKLSVGSHFSDPKSFLLAVMNDPSASAGQRIEAAKALLPYFEKASSRPGTPL